MLAVLGSGMSSMSDASMPFQPAIDEPSKACPDVNLSSSNGDQHAHVLLLATVSVNRKSTNLISFSFTMFITSATVLAISSLQQAVGLMFGILEIGRGGRNARGI